MAPARGLFSVTPGRHTARQRLSPKSWATKEFRLFFICPITCARAETNNGEGYRITMPKDWVVKYGPAIQVGLHVLKIALAAGRIAGLPLPGLPPLRTQVA